MDDRGGLEEAVEITCDQVLAAALQAAIAEKGDAEILTKEEALARFVIDSIAHRSDTYRPRS